MKMSVVPIAVIVLSLGVIFIAHINLDRPVHLVLAGVLFTAVYAPLFWKFSMNRSERELLLEPIKKFGR